MRPYLMGACLIISGACLIVVGVCLSLSRATPIVPDTPVPIPIVSAPPPQSLVPGPPCVHETCAPRARFLNCLDVHPGGTAPETCLRWEIMYEHHCDCDRWAPMTP